MTIHSTPHPLACQTVSLKDGRTLHVEDWWDRAAGQSWQLSQVPAAYEYAVRVFADGLPLDNEVVYGKDPQGFGHLVHTTEITEGPNT